jgi:hypothetical protein
MHTPTAPQFQIENVGWTSTEPDYRPHCLGCPWHWQPTTDEDPLASRQAAAHFAHSTPPACRRTGLQTAR